MMDFTHITASESDRCAFDAGASELCHCANKPVCATSKDAAHTINKK
jgi:hypothetical protein